MSSRFKTLISSLLAASVLASCSSITQKTGSEIDTARVDASSQLSKAALPLAKADISPVKISSGVYVGTRSVKNENGDPLPSKVEIAKAITIADTKELDLRGVAKVITEQTKIPVVISATAPVGNAQAAAATPDAQPTGPNIAPGPVPEGFPLEQALAQLNAAAPSGMPAMVATELPVRYVGPLSGFLDVVSSQFDVAWKYENGRVVLDTVVTRSFDVPALSMVSSMKFDLSTKSTSAGGSSAGSTPDAGQQASASFETDILKEIDETLGKMLPTDRGTYAVNRSTGTVTVTSSPAVMTRVNNYLTSMNQRLSKQVAISVKVYTLTLNDSENFDLDVKGILNKASYGVGLGNSSALAGVIPSAEGTPGLGWAIVDETSKAYGSNALVSALSQRGDISVVTTSSVTTLSGVPVPLQVGGQRDYVKKVEVTPGTDGAQSTASIETGSVSTGFSMQINPRVERNGDILVQYGINMSELAGAEDGFDTYETMGTKVQLPNVNQRNFIQQTRIPNNNTLVLAGYESVRNETKRRGVGSPNFPLFGGGTSSSKKREIIVIMITPTLLSHQ